MPRPLFGRVLDASERTEIVRRSTGQTVRPLYQTATKLYTRYPTDGLFAAYSEQLAYQKSVQQNQLVAEWSLGSPENWDITLPTIKHTAESGPHTLRTLTTFYHCAFSFRIPEGDTVSLTAGIYSSTGGSFTFVRDVATGTAELGSITISVPNMSPGDLITIRVFKDVATLLINGVQVGDAYTISDPNEAGPYYAQLTSSSNAPADAITDYSFSLIPVQWWTVIGYGSIDWTLSKVGAVHRDGLPAVSVWKVPYASATATFSMASDTFDTLRVGLTLDPLVTKGPSFRGVAITNSRYGTIPSINVNGNLFGTYDPASILSIEVGNGGDFIVSQDGSELTTVANADEGLPFYFFVESLSTREGISGFSYVEAYVPVWEADVGSSLDDWKLAYGAASLSNDLAGNPSTIQTIASNVYPYAQYTLSMAPGGPGEFMYTYLRTSSIAPVSKNFLLSSDMNLTIESQSASIALTNITISYSSNLTCFMQLSSNFIITGTLSGGQRIEEAYIVYDYQNGSQAPSDPLGFRIDAVTLGGGIKNFIFNTDASKDSVYWSNYDVYPLSDWNLTHSSAIKNVTAGGTVRTKDAYQSLYMQYNLSMNSVAAETMVVSLIGPTNTFSQTYEIDQGGYLSIRAEYSEDIVGVSPVTFLFDSNYIGFMEISSTFVLAGFMCNDGTRLFEYTYSNVTPDSNYYGKLDVITASSGFKNFVFNTDASMTPTPVYWTVQPGSGFSITDWTVTSNSAIKAITGNSVVLTTVSHAYPYVEFTVSAESATCYASLTSDPLDTTSQINFSFIESSGMMSVQPNFVTPVGRGATFPTPSNFRCYMQLSAETLFFGCLSGGDALFEYSTPQGLFTPTSQPLYFAVTSAISSAGLKDIVFNSDSSRNPIPPRWQASDGSSLENWKFSTLSDAVLQGFGSSNEVITTDTSLAYGYFGFKAVVVPDDSNSLINVGVKDSRDPDFMVGASTFMTISSDGASNITFTLSSTGINSSPPSFAQLWDSTLGGFIEVSSNFILAGVLSNGTRIHEFKTDFSTTANLYGAVYASIVGDGVSNVVFNTDTSQAPTYWTVASGNGSITDWTTTPTSVSMNTAANVFLITSTTPYPVSNTYFAFYNKAPVYTGGYIGLTRQPTLVGAPDTTDQYELWYDTGISQIALGNTVLLSDVFRYAGAKIELQTTASMATIRLTTSLGAFIAQRSVAYDGTGGAYQYAGINDGDSSTATVDGIVLCNSEVLDHTFQDVSYGWQSLGTSPTLYDWNLDASSASTKTFIPVAMIATSVPIPYPYTSWTVSLDSQNSVDIRLHDTLCNDYAVGNSAYLTYATDGAGNVEVSATVPGYGPFTPFTTAYVPGEIGGFLEVSSGFFLAGVLSNGTRIHEFSVDSAILTDPLYVSICSSYELNGIKDFIFNTDASQSPTTPPSSWVDVDGFSLTDWKLTSNSAVLGTNGMSTVATISSNAYPYAEFTLSMAVDSQVIPGFRSSDGSNIMLMSYFAVDASTMQVRTTFSNTIKETVTIPNTPGLKGFMQLSDTFILTGTLSGTERVQQYVESLATPSGTMQFSVASDTTDSGVTGLIFNTDASKLPFVLSNGWANAWGWSVSGSEATEFDISYDSNVPFSSNTLIYQNSFAPHVYDGLTYRSITLSGITLDLATPNAEIAALGFGDSASTQDGYYMTLSTFTYLTTDKYMAIIHEPSGGVLATLSNGGVGFNTTYSPRVIAYNMSGTIFQIIDGTGAVAEEDIENPIPYSGVNPSMYAYIHAGNSDILTYSISRYIVPAGFAVSNYFSAIVTVNSNGGGSYCNVIAVTGVRDPPGYTLTGYVWSNETENTSIALGTNGLDSNGSNAFFVRTGVSPYTTDQCPLIAQYVDVLGGNASVQLDIAVLMT